MLANYLKMFIRLFFKQACFTLINIVGLAAGLACCLVIALVLRNEFSFDRFFSNSENLYRISMVRTLPTGEVVPQATTPLPLAPALADTFTAVAATARLAPRGSVILAGEDAIFEEEFKIVDPSFFQLFDFNWLEGDEGSALSGANDVIVTRGFVEKYFGEGSALGESVAIADGITFRVTGIIEDFPANTHLSGTAFVSETMRESLGRGVPTGREWAQTATNTYVALHGGTDIEQFQEQLDTFARANIPQQGNASATLRAVPITDIHLNPSFGDWTPAGRPWGNKTMIAVFSAVGVGILLVACANFVNLSTARSSQRFYEIGLRLTLGARRSQLLVQFLGESVMFVLLAMLLALAFAELSLPWVEVLLERDLAFDSLFEALPLPAIVGAGLLLGLLAGWYPAVLMSGYAPVQVMKDPSRSQLRGMALKNVLVVLQFAIAVGILIASAVIYLQMRHVGTMDKGYVSDDIVILAIDGDLASYGRRQLLKERLLQGSGITGVTLTDTTPDRIREGTSAIAEGSDTEHQLAWLSVDFDYFTVYDIALRSGRLPSETIASDRVRTAPAGGDPVSGNVVISESAAREFLWSAEEAPGKRISSKGAWFQVIGVVEDTIDTAYDPARSAIYAVPEDNSSLRFLALKFAGNAATSAMTFVERTWKELNPNEPLTSIFQSELVEQRYHDDNKRRSFAFLFAAMAIVISCMGLFGLANFSAQRRVKEIGVRKVLGSSVWGIVLLLTNDFSKLVLISNLIAWPVAYLAMQRWLEQFAYRIDITPLVFIGSGLIALCVAWVTVGSTAAKAASQKPVLALRYE